jgi:acetyl esterase/lipase
MPFKLDAEVAAALQVMTSDPPPPGPALGDVQAHRDALGANLKLMYETNYPKEDPTITEKDFYTTSADGHRVMLRWYWKSSPDSEPGPAILFIHSGGTIIGKVTDFDNILHYYVAKTGVPFLSVEYRLSPEVQYPKALEDVYAGLVWLHQHAGKLGVDPGRVAVMGESAGGLLAAALCIYAREKGDPAISKQLLVYPMLDDRSVKADKDIRPFLVWRDVDNQTGWDAYLGSDVRGSEAVPATAAPARLVDAAGLPPVYIEVGELDLFREENVMYASKFWRAAVRAELHVFPDLPHGYELMAPKAKATQEAVAYRLKAIASVRTT